MEPLYIYLVGISVATLHLKSRWLKLRDDRKMMGIPPHKQVNSLDNIICMSMVALMVWAMFKISWLWVVGGGVMAMFAGGVLCYVIPPIVGLVGTPLLTVYVWVFNPPW